MNTTTPIKADLNTVELELKFKDMYRTVARNPHGDFYFEMGRAMAERLGYPAADLDRTPLSAIESFVGVGYYFDLADLQEGETVVDLGNGSGMDTFVASLHVGKNGEVIGVDMTDEQHEKAQRLRAEGGFDNVTYRKGYIEDVPYEDGTHLRRAVISNGVINLTPDKQLVFSEVERLLRYSGRIGVCPPCSKTHGVTEENMVQNSNWMGGRGGGHAGGEAAADHGTLIAPARTAQGRAS